MKTTLIITGLLIALGSARAQEIVPLPEATKKQIQQQLADAKQAHVEVSSIQSAKALAIYAPRPQYPYEARSRHITGRAVVGVRVSPKTGLVTNAALLRKSGSAILDNAAISAFRQWAFAPNTITTGAIAIPVTFCTTAAEYQKLTKSDQQP
jgi:TonB family protein